MCRREWSLQANMLLWLAVDLTSSLVRWLSWPPSNVTHVLDKIVEPLRTLC